MLILRAVKTDLVGDVMKKEISLRLLWGRKSFEEDRVSGPDSDSAEELSTEWQRQKMCQPAAFTTIIVYIPPCISAETAVITDSVWEARGCAASLHVWMDII